MLAAEIVAGRRPGDDSLQGAISTLLDAADAHCVHPILSVTERLTDHRRRLSALKVYADQLCAAVGPATFRDDQAAAELLGRHGVVASCS